MFTAGPNVDIELSAFACPDKGTFTIGVSESLEETARFAVLSPGEVGANLILKVQVSDGGMAWPEQLLLSTLNSSAFSPEIINVPICRFDYPEFDTVNN